MVDFLGDTKGPGWHPGPLSGHKDYEIDEVLRDSEGRIVARLECFTSNSATYYCNAFTPAGEHKRIGAGTDYAGTKDWAERVAGLKPHAYTIDPHAPPRMSI